MLSRPPVLLLLAPAVLFTRPGSGLAQRTISDFEAVTAEILVDPDPGDWPAFGRSVYDYRYSPLDQIDRGNVGGLQLVWSRAMEPGENQSQPLAYHGVLYVPNPRDVIQAIDGETGDLIWEHRRRHRYEPEEMNSMGEVVRGIALFGDKLYYVSWDNVVVALDARTGAVVWEAERGDVEEGVSNSTGPIVADGVVVAGSFCQFSGRDCYVTAHDAETGEELWRNSPVPRPGEPGDETWGGAPMEARWMTGVWGQLTWDPVLDLVNYGSSGVGPASETQRGMPGATLWGSDTRFTVRPRTGEIVWTHQTLPRDNWDQECTFEMVPAVLDVRPSPTMEGLQAIGPNASGEGRRVLMGMPCKTGQIWVFDAETGEFLWVRDTVYQDIVSSIDENGLVTVNEDKILKNVGEAVVHCPAHQGGRVWPPSAYNPETRVMFFVLKNLCQNSTPRPVTPEPAMTYNLDEYRVLAPGKQNAGRIDAVNMETGETVWTWENYMVLYAPMMITAGDLLFGGGIDRYFRAHDQETGEVLWRTRLPSQIQGHPISYSVNGRQYVAVAAGGGAGPKNQAPTPGVDTITGSNALFVFALPDAR